MRSSTIKDAAREAAREFSDRAAEQVYVDQLRERLAPVVEHAIRLAREQAASASVAAGQARGWATPRMTAAVERGRLAAAPHLEAAVEAAAERIGPAVDAARDRVVEDLVPRLVDAVHHAAVAGTAATTVAGDTVSRRVEEAARSLAAATPTGRARAARRRRRARALWLSLGLGVLAAIAAAARQAKVRRAAAWEVPATEVGSSGSVANGSTMDLVAAAAGPADAGTVLDEPVSETGPSEVPAGEAPIAEVPTAEEPVTELPDVPAEPVDPVAPLGSAPSTGVDAEPGRRG